MNKFILGVLFVFTVHLLIRLSFAQEEKLSVSEKVELLTSQREVLSQENARLSLRVQALELLLQSCDKSITIQGLSSKLNSDLKAASDKAGCELDRNFNCQNRKVK